MAEPAAPLKPKSSLRKPAWLVKSEAKMASQVANDSSTEDASTELFSRSGDLYEGIVREEQRQQRLREEKRLKKAKEREQAHKETEEALQQRQDGREVKRRRISEEDEGPADRGSVSDGSPNPSTPRRETRVDVEDPEYSPSKRKGNKRPEIITLGDSSEDEAPKLRSRTLRSSQHKQDNDVEVTVSRRRPIIEEPEPELLEGETEEFPELAARARQLAAERERQRQIQTDDSHTAQDIVHAEKAIAPDLPDPVVDVFINPRLYGTDPLLVKRRYRQRFKEVREAWIERQPQLPPGCTKNDVIFAFNNRKIYDFTTIKTLGIELDDAGNPIMSTGRKGVTEPGDKVVIVATTQAILDEDVKEEKERRRRREMGEPSQEEEAVAEEPAPMPPQETIVHVVLKSKDFQEFKLKVKPDTSFKRMANVYKIQQKLAPETEVTLYFDGDELEPSTCMKDTEIEDFDAIDVRIKY